MRAILAEGGVENGEGRDAAAAPDMLLVHRQLETIVGERLIEEALTLFVDDDKAAQSPLRKYRLLSLGRQGEVTEGTPQV